MAVPTARDLQPVQAITARLQALLERARSLKPARTLEPPLPTSELAPDISALHDGFTEAQDQAFRQNAVEAAAREVLFALITSADIHDPAFVEVWNLLDILMMCSDEGRCAATLAPELLEELLDSQTTQGCRIVFDYMESRRERLAQKDFHKKNLSFLRSCNELLRRLSRAEDAIFCGRVFFFLFQTFPLGDKSSVNLRGEFHTENTTRFEVGEAESEQDGEKMEIDSEVVKNGTATPKFSTPQPPSKPGSKAVLVKVPPKKDEEVVLSNGALYAMFWQLQQDFSDPTRLFSADNFQAFRRGLDRTITKFKKTPTVVQTQSSNNGKRGTKRRRGDDGATSDENTNRQLADNYNPKYLTSRDLFDLELSDLAFQRHILVQSLILIDFLLSLTEKAKKRLATIDATNKSMLYSFTLNEDDSRWASQTRQNITAYLSASPEGRLFNRMVETVLARDKNWIRWKVESCPSIVRDPVSTSSEMDARKGVRDATKIRWLPERPNGAMDVSFLDDSRGGGLDALKAPSRYTIPTTDELLDGTETDQLDLEFADGDEKVSLENAIANKRWKLLRQTRASRLALLDKVEPGKGLMAVFRPPTEDEEIPDAEVEEGSGEGATLENGQREGQHAAVVENGGGVGHEVLLTAAEEVAATTGGNPEQRADRGESGGEKLEVE